VTSTWVMISLPLLKYDVPQDNQACRAASSRILASGSN
jgi:hypothetical protein